jgi:two-component system chemotaxis sensor kinase CheA
VNKLEKETQRLIKDILVQLTRNSVVHGIEKPEQRTAKGKNETGLIQLSIERAEDSLVVQLSDDGAGIDYEKVRIRATSLNLISAEDENNKQQLLKAMFSPGFTTAESAGLHGGRGIGLNLVHDRVSSAKGTIKLQSTKDKGTTFIISLPIKATV